MLRRLPLRVLGAASGAAGTSSAPARRQQRRLQRRFVAQGQAQQRRQVGLSIQPAPQASARPMSPARRMRPQARQSCSCSVAAGPAGVAEHHARLVGRDQFEMAVAEAAQQVQE
jgi:hypothetical protein